jgi:hypothetical protein
MEKIEKKVAETLLEKCTKIVLGGKEYEIAPPTIATMVLVSEKISELPTFDYKNITAGEEVFFATLSDASKCGKIADIVAILIVGARKYKKSLERGLLRRMFGRKSEFDRIRDLVMETSPSDIDGILGLCLKGLQVGDFFGIITFLNRVNLTKKTKLETTASGQ